MFDRFEKPLKIIFLALAALLVWQLSRLVLRGDPLANVKIPALPALTESANETVNVETNTVVAKPTNSSAPAMAIRTNATPTAGGKPRRKAIPLMPPGMIPGMMAGGKKIELPPETQARVNKIIDSEILGPAPRPMPIALLGIADDEAFIQATNGQSGPVKIGGEMGGIKLLRIGINRVLVEDDGEKKELTLFGGLGGESLMPPETNAPLSHVPTNNVSTNQPLSSKQKETH